MNTRLPTLLVLSLVLLGSTACNKTKEVREAPETAVSPKETQLPEEVPDYVRDSDAKAVSRSETDDMVRIEMETINGITSPVTYYRNSLTENDWIITKDKEQEDGSIIIEAKKRSTNIYLTFTQEGPGTKIELIVEK